MAIDHSLDYVTGDTRSFLTTLNTGGLHVGFIYEQKQNLVIGLNKFTLVYFLLARLHGRLGCY